MRLYKFIRVTYSTPPQKKTGWDFNPGLIWLAIVAVSVVLHIIEDFFGWSHYEFYYAISQVRTNLVRFLEFTA
jgi:hypothetical protein